MAKHSSKFLELAEKAREKVREVTVQDINAKLDHGDRFYLIDVREESEWATDHLPQAIYLGRGIIERDIEKTIPDTNAEMAFYCGGGYRSVLVAESLQKMGYTNVCSIAGGIRAWREAGYELVKEEGTQN